MSPITGAVLTHLLDELAAGKGHSATMEPVVFDLASVADQKIETLQALVNSLTQEKTSLEEKVLGHCCVVGWGLFVWFLVLLVSLFGYY